MDESGQKDQQVESLIDKCQEATQAQKDEMLQLFEENNAYRRIITMISEAEDEEHEIQRFGKQLQSGVDEERAKLMELRMRWAVEARKRRRGGEQEQRRQEEQRQRRHEEQGQNTEQEQGKKSKHVRFGEEEQTKETWTESTDKLEATRRLTEVQTGRGSAGLVRGGDERCRTDEISRKGKGKGNEGKGEHEGKGGGFGHSGETARDEGERGGTGPNGAKHGSRPEEEEMKEEEKKGVRRLRWADSEDDEGKEEEVVLELVGLETEEQGETTEERPPGLEEVESKQEAKQRARTRRRQRQRERDGREERARGGEKARARARAKARRRWRERGA